MPGLELSPLPGRPTCVQVGRVGSATRVFWPSEECYISDLRAQGAFDGADNSHRESQERQFFRANLARMSDPEYFGQQLAIASGWGTQQQLEAEAAREDVRGNLPAPTIPRPPMPYHPTATVTPPPGVIPMRSNGSGPSVSVGYGTRISAPAGYDPWLREVWDWGKERLGIGGGGRGPTVDDPFGTGFVPVTGGTGGGSQWGGPSVQPPGSESAVTQWCRGTSIPSWVCDMGDAAIEIWRSGQGGSGGSGSNGAGNGAGGTPLVAGGVCPVGYRWDGARCVAEGIGGFGQRIVPGGQTGTGADVYGTAVMGAFGIPAVQPTQAGTVIRDGQSFPTWKCPAGSVLGKDDKCYMKGSIPRQFRKWKPAPRPPVTAADAKAIRRAERVTGKVKNLSKAVGLSCTTRRRR